MSEFSTSSAARPEWMRRQGYEIYEGWTTQLLDASDEPDFWDSYAAKVQKSVDENKGMPDLDMTTRLLSHPSKGMIAQVDRQRGVSTTRLSPRVDEILHYTSAAQIRDKFNLSDEEAVAYHAHDSLNFSIGLSMGIANDTALEHIAPDAHERFSPLQPDEHLARLEFAANALRNASFINSLKELRVSGFAVIEGDAAQKIETDEFRTGWRNRHSRLMGEEYQRKQPVTSALSYDPTTDTFHPKPQTLRHLRDELKRQNSEGIDDLRRSTMGAIEAFELPISRGCPVKDAIGRTAIFTSRAVSVVHQVVASR